MRRPRKVVVISDEYGPYTDMEMPVRHECNCDVLTVSDLTALLDDCPMEARVFVSAGEEPAINVSWDGGYYAIPAPALKNDKG